MLLSSGLVDPRAIEQVLRNRPYHCADNSDGKIKRASELPPRARLERHSLHLPVVVLVEAVSPLQLAELLLQGPLLCALTVRLQRFEDGGSYKQV